VLIASLERARGRSPTNPVSGLAR